MTRCDLCHGQPRREAKYANYCILAHGKPDWIFLCYPHARGDGTHNKTLWSREIRRTGW